MNKVIIAIILIALLGIAGFFFMSRRSNVAPVIQRSAVEKITPTSSAPSESNQPQESNVSGKPLVTQNGRTLISVESLQTEKTKIFEANPQLKKLSAYMGEKELDRNLLQGLTSQYVMEQYIKKNNIDQTTSYKSDLQSALKDVERMINTKYFTQNFPSQVSDADIKKFYEDNKAMMPNLITSRGGIMTKDVVFDKEADAKSFADKVKAKNNNITQVAKDAGIAENRIRDLKLVNDQSVGIDNAIKASVTQMTSLPQVQVVKTSDNKYSVVVATSKEEPKYLPLNDQVKNEIKNYLEREKQAEVVEREIDKLKKEYNIVVDESYFGAPDQAKGEEQTITPEMLEMLSQEEGLPTAPMA
jgi:hypothetical protein